MNSMYFWQFSGSSPVVFAAAIDCFHPGRVAYSTSTLSSSSRSAATGTVRHEHEPYIMSVGRTREAWKFLAVDEVLDRDLNLIEVVQDVQLR